MWLFVWSVLLFPMCEQTAKALARLHGCAGPAEPFAVRLCGKYPFQMGWLKPSVPANFNPLMPSVPFWGPWQTVQNTAAQIRWCRMWHLIRVYTVCSQKFLFKIEKKKEKSTPHTPKIGNGFAQLIKMDKSIGQTWVNIAEPGNRIQPRTCYEESSKITEMWTVILMWQLYFPIEPKENSTMN